MHVSLYQYQILEQIVAIQFKKCVLCIIKPKKKKKCEKAMANNGRHTIYTSCLNLHLHSL